MDHRPGAGWRRSGDAYEVEWGGGIWTLDHRDGRVGLRPPGGEWTHLTLAGLAATGRRDDGVFTPAALSNLEIVHGRLLATFEPNGWHGLSVRAAWGPSQGGRGMDMEVQASATSVGELKRLEVIVETVPTAGAVEGQWPGVVYPRDRAAAALSYDGRESAEALAYLVTGSVPRPGHSNFEYLASRAGETDRFFHAGHPQDVARWMILGGPSYRYGLFGFDLEKGVVLRGRLREVRFDAAPSESDFAEERRIFLDEPPPLRTD